MADPSPTEPAWDASETSPDDIDRQVQILTTEHFTLVTQRGSMINEATGRAGLYLTSVSMAMVALGFIAQATEMGPAFEALATVFLLSLLMVGMITFVRVVETGVEDSQLARRLGRVQRFYQSVSPGAARWLEPPGKGDQAVADIVVGGKDRWQVFLTTGSMVGAVNAVVAGALTGLAGTWWLDLPLPIAVTAGLAGFVGVAALLHRIQVRVWTSAEGLDQG